MVSANEEAKLRKMFARIKTVGLIGRTELQKESGKMSISTYNKLKPYLLEKYRDELGYDVDRKVFYLLNPDTEEHVHTIKEFLKTNG